MEHEEFAREYAAMQRFRYTQWFTLNSESSRDQNEPVYIQPNRADRRKAKRRKS